MMLLYETKNQLVYEVIPKDGAHFLDCRSLGLGFSRALLVSSGGYISENALASNEDKGILFLAACSLQLAAPSP